MNFINIKSKAFQYKTETAFFLAGFVLCGIIFIIFFHQKDAIVNVASDKNNYEVRKSSGFKFINPLIECELEGEESLNKYIPFEKKAKSLISNEIIEKNQDVHLAVYFRNLNNGPWFGINERDEFSPASMLKVVLLMAFLKLSEEDSSLLSKTVTLEPFESSTGLLQNIKPKEGIKLGNSYTIDELLMRMIVFSDNQAMDLLLRNIRQKDIDKIYLDLGIEIPGIRKADDFMSVKDYASFFRMLYNAAYLNQKNSEKALFLLSQVDYKKGLVGNLPPEIQVAHKFGEREFQENGKNIKQLHDCGIIYYEKYPYLICIMTRGNDYEKLSEVIGKTSEIIFNEIKAEYQ